MSKYISDFLSLVSESSWSARNARLLTLVLIKMLNIIFKWVKVFDFFKLAKAANIEIQEGGNNSFQA